MLDGSRAEVGCPRTHFQFARSREPPQLHTETDFHEQAETEFALETAEFLNERVRIDDLDELVIVAPPRALGVLRKHLSREALAQLIAEIPKDLVKHPIAEIERLLTAYPEPA